MSNNVYIIREFRPFNYAYLKTSELTLIIGRNSTGKSLLAHTYLILSRAMNPFILLIHTRKTQSREIIEGAKYFLEKSLKRFKGQDPRNLVKEGKFKGLLELEKKEGRIRITLTRENGIENVELELSKPVKEYIEYIEITKALC